MVGFQSNSNASRDSVIVVMDANRNKGSVDALEWAIKYLVRPKDLVIVLGVLSEVGRKSSTSCFPLGFGIGISGIWVKLEFSGQGEMSPRELEYEIERKREEYQCIFQPFYRQCKKNEVKLEVKLAAGYDPRKITVDEAHIFNPRWIIIDSHLRKHKVYIYGHVACNVAAMKRKGVATLMPSKGFEHEQWQRDCERMDDVAFTDIEHDRHQDEGLNPPQDIKPFSPPPTPQSPCWYPLSWSTGFPRAFTLSELEVMTNSFANEGIVHVSETKTLYEAIYQETPVLISCFSNNNDQAWSLLEILSRVRHRSIMNLVGYCCTGDSLFLLSDYPCSGSLQMNLKCDESAKNFSWKARWHVALDVGAGVRYLHEECADGAIVDLSISLNSVVLCHGSSAMLRIVQTAKWLKDVSPSNEESPARGQNTEEHECVVADVCAYGMFLIELISGMSAKYFEEKGEGQSLITWALPLLEDGLLSQVMDQRIIDTTDAAVVDHMARAAVLCLKNDLNHKTSISEVLAVVRGDEFAMTKEY